MSPPGMYSLNALAMLAARSAVSAILSLTRGLSDISFFV